MYENMLRLYLVYGFFLKSSWESHEDDSSMHKTTFVSLKNAHYQGELGDDFGR